MEQIDIIQILRQFKNENHKKYSILSIGIFGSVARGSFKDQSDIDVVVELGNGVSIHYQYGIYFATFLLL